MNRQGAMWVQLTAAQQLGYHERARQHQVERRGELNSEWRQLSDELDKIEVEQQEVSEQGTALTMSSAALDDEDLELFDRLYQQPGFRSSRVLATRRASVGIAPRPQPLSRLPEVWQLKDPPMPTWSVPLIRDRKLFQGSALVIQREDRSVEFWKIGFISQNPQYMAVCRLYEATEYLPCIACLKPVDRLYSFHCNFADSRHAGDIVIGDKDEVSILFRLQHTGGTHVCSDMRPHDLASVMTGNQEDLPEFKKNDEPKAKKAKVVEDTVLEMPWLQHLDTKSGFEITFDALKAARKKASRSRSSADEDELDDDMMLQGLADLEKARVVASEEQSASGLVDFVSKVRGGESQVLASGEALHAMHGAEPQVGICMGEAPEFTCYLQGNIFAAWACGVQDSVSELVPSNATLLQCRSCCRRWP